MVVGDGADTATIKTTVFGSSRRGRYGHGDRDRPAGKLSAWQVWRWPHHPPRTYSCAPPLYVLFTITTALPRDFPHSATSRVLHGVSAAGSDSMQRVVILPLVASLAFFIALSLARGGRGTEPLFDVRAEL